jgi:primosomal protein N' (replication factor Y) (superfamily II helicase)
VGARVRIVLNGRRVGGWITNVSRYGEGGSSDVPLDRLMPIVSVSGLGVEPELILLTKWISERWWGSWRAVLSSASAPRMRERVVHSRRTRSQDIGTDTVSVAAFELFQAGGGLLVVPPALSSLAVVLRLACIGPVLVICPSQKMASMGAAFLRRKGLSTALVPDEWDSARGGVDVVIGTRSGVFAPCPDLAAVVVIDEHDELLKEERSPAWDATAVGSERARRTGVPFICTSAVPSAQSSHMFSGHITHVKTGNDWPEIVVVDLSDIPVAQSLLSTELLEAVGTSGATTVCVLNTKGKARLIVCKTCRHMQSCPSCTSLLTYDDDNNLWCVRCQKLHGGVCLACGRAAFTVPRGGVSQLVSQIEASTRNPVVEISSESPDDWNKGTIFIGTEAVLHRIPTADTVVFADIDRDLGAPRMTGAQEVLSMIAKAARMVGAKGSLVIQTRQVESPLIVALSQTDVSTALQKWSDADTAQRHAMMLPPFGAIARVLVMAPRSLTEITLPAGVHTARDEDAVLLRAPSRTELDSAISIIRSEFGTAVRIHIDPYRF